MLKNASNQGGANSVTVALGMLVASKTAALENYLAVSTWILNGFSIECHEKKYQPLSLCSIWKPGGSNFWVKICLALEDSIFQVEWLIATLISSLNSFNPSRGSYYCLLCQRRLHLVRLQLVLEYTTDLSVEGGERLILIT